MTTKMTQLEYAKTYAPSSRIPESFLTMGDVVELLERIEELKAEVKNLDEGARLLHSVAMNGETSVLSRLDNGVDVQDAVRWQDEPTIEAVTVNGYAFNSNHAKIENDMRQKLADEYNKLFVKEK